MSSPNTNNSYAGAVKKQKAKSSQRSSSNATSPVSKRKREDSSYSAERKNVNEAIEPPKNGKNDDEEESFLSVSDEIQYSAAGDRSAGKTEIEEDVTDLFLSASSVMSYKDITHEKRYLSSSPISSNSTSSSGSSFEIETVETCRIKLIAELQLDKLVLSSQLQDEETKSADFAESINKILKASISGLVEAKDEILVVEEQRALAFNFLGPLKELHGKLDGDLTINAIIQNKLKMALNSIVEICRDLSQKHKKPNPLVVKSKVLCQSLNQNRTPNSENKTFNSDISKISNDKFTKVQQFSQGNTNSSKSKKLSLAVEQSSSSSSSFDQAAHDEKYLKARRVRFYSDQTKNFVEKKSSDSLIEIEIPNVKVTVPFKNQVLQDEFEFRAEFPGLLDIVKQRVKEIHESNEIRESNEKPPKKTNN